MKYFTPERYLRLQDTSDSTAWLAAHSEWEQAVQSYWTEVRALIARLPRSRSTDGVRRYLKQGSLHDATVIACWYEGSEKLKLQVQPELPGERLVLLEYTLTQEPTILGDRLPSELCGGPLEWMYDELESLPGAVDTNEIVFLHSILLNNGWELMIPFSRLKVSRCQALWPTPDHGLFSPQPLSQPA
jgi:hypothetical protein